MSSASHRRIAAKHRLQDAITACGLPVHQGLAILAAADSYAKAMLSEVLEGRQEASRHDPAETVACAA